jgi:hypothetical protein
MAEEISITPEAKRLLEEESMLIAQQLEQEAIAEALRNRGRPVEVTSSDVRRARIRFVKRDRPLLPVTDLLLRLYMFGGLFLLAGGFLYPLIRSYLSQQDAVTHTSLLISLMGLTIALVGFLGRYYIHWREQLRARQKYEEYEQERYERQ